MENCDQRRINRAIGNEIIANFWVKCVSPKFLLIYNAYIRNIIRSKRMIYTVYDNIFLFQKSNACLHSYVHYLYILPHVAATSNSCENPISQLYRGWWAHIYGSILLQSAFKYKWAFNLSINILYIITSHSIKAHLYGNILIFLQHRIPSLSTQLTHDEDDFCTSFIGK